MAKTIRDLLVKVGVKADSSQLTTLNKKLGMTTQTARRLGVAMAAVGAVVTGAVVHFAKAGAQAEKSQVAFETMTGSMEKANQIMRQMEDFALETPFSFGEVEKNVKLLKAMGIESKNLFPTIRSLGDVAAGLNVPLERIALNFGQVKAQGKLTGRELRDFAIAGVPIREALAKNIGVPLNQVADLISKGKIGFDDVKKAFQSMAGPGGNFNNLMAKMSKTMGGVVSNLGVMWSLLSRDIGKEINKDLSPVINELFGFLKENRVVIAKGISSALRSIIGSLKTIGLFLFKFRKAFAFIGALAGFAALGKAVTMLGTALTLTGNKGLIAWLKIMGPLIAIGALAVAVGLILEDVWTGFSDKDADSGFKSLMKWLGLWKALHRVIDLVKQAMRDISNMFFKLISGGLGKDNTISRGIKTKEEKSIFSEIGEDISNIFNMISDPFNLQPPVASNVFGAGYNNITAPITVNVNGTNATPGQIGTAARNGVQEAIMNANNNTEQRQK